MEMYGDGSDMLTSAFKSSLPASSSMLSQLFALASRTWRCPFLKARCMPGAKSNVFASLPGSVPSETMFCNRAALDGVMKASSSDFNECYIECVSIKGHGPWE